MSIAINPSLTSTKSDAPSRALIIAAFAAIYLVWGSTYLAIRIAVYTLPPLLMAGLRFTLAGGMLFAWAWWNGAPLPTRVHWKSTALVGGLLLLGGNGGLCWAEQRVATGLAALIIATVPLWIMLLRWMFEGVRPNALALAGLGLGFVGLVVLVGPSLSSGTLDLFGVIVVLLGSISWAAGSLIARWVALPRSTLMATGMEMLSGGLMLVTMGTLCGEYRSLDLAAFTPHAVMALGYLICFGSIVGFTAYVWLLGVASPAAVSTYAYVNPIVAMILGGLFLNETMGLRMLVAAAVTLVGVGFITASTVPRAERVVMEAVEVPE